MAIESFKLNCAADAPTTGTKGCKINMKDIVKAFFARKNTSLNATTDTLDQAKVDELVRAGSLVPMPSHIFTPQPEATVYETQPNGEKDKVRDGIYEFLLKYTNKGVCFGNKLSKFALSDWDVWLVDSSGTLFLTKNGTDFVGFSTKLVDRDSVAINDATGVVTAYNMIVQMDTVGSQNFYNNAQPITPEVNLLAIEGINDVTLTVSGTPGATVAFTAANSCDNTTEVLGMETLIRAVDATGAVTTGTATYANGIYTWTPGTALAAGNYIIEFYDTAATSEVVKDSEGAYYKSNDLAITIP